MRSIDWGYTSPKTLHTDSLIFDHVYERRISARKAYLIAFLISLIVMPIVFLAGMSYGVQAPHSRQDAIKDQMIRDNESKYQYLLKQNAALRDTAINQLIYK